MLHAYQQLQHSHQQHTARHQHHSAARMSISKSTQQWMARYILISHDLISHTNIHAKLCQQHAQDCQLHPSSSTHTYPLLQMHIKMFPPGTATHPNLATHTHLFRFTLRPTPCIPHPHYRPPA
ncbi:hypothetical protein BDQ12DRAFT_128795 [Crucibulum laeve]|uniref:Uncharacterized protein n=1 Tax=Crucibulum laeve TaxID=68775 RepID=A0A5C3LRX3_9AGAR|nr:hypothetical protein BDQ12DRAFT_128795 [Crucibulum laeve]